MAIMAHTAMPWVAAHDPGAHAQKRRPGVHDDDALAHAIAFAQKHVVQVLAVGLLDGLVVVQRAG